MNPLRKTQSYLITGCSGALGSGLAKMLLSQGRRVIAVTRNPGSPAAQELAQLGARVVKSDVTNAHQALALPAASVLVHLVETRDLALGRPHLWRVNVGAVCNMLDWARNTGAARVILRSSTAALGLLGSHEGEVNEEHPCRPEDLAGRSRLTAERAAVQWATKHRVPLAIARLAPVFGRHAFWEPLARAIRFARTGVLAAEPADDYLHPLPFTDAVGALLALAGDGRNVIRTYHASGAERLTERELFRRVAGLAGKPQAQERLGPRPPSLGEARHQGYSCRRLQAELIFRPTPLDPHLTRAIETANARPPVAERTASAGVPDLVRRLGALLTRGGSVAASARTVLGQ